MARHSSSMNLAAATLPLALAACATSPPAKFYTLNAQTPQENVHLATPVSIAIDKVSVPEMVDRPQFVLRTSAAQVRIDEYTRWAEPLKEQIAHVLAADLAQSLPGALVSTTEQWDQQDQSYRVSIEVQRFESVPGDAATIAALWTVRSAKTGKADSGRTFAQEPLSSQSYDELVDAHSRALADVSADIARAIHATLPP
ncbi:MULTISPECIES: membrane integrity-associated transporter subunit PqiC [unclassified Achromobacter]|uniref:PqiC family protein n=1 Tax=unclassified Achromobacter TaxID=2626865 RepID=UPI000B51E63F|nr:MULTISPECIES: PqiC family protein [unclassified Achromobacter]OWT75533.1 hypothetical protein CEY04_18330 [Achromobacter sp. HZ28]OWT76194.1 hypothetical protein CEY05_13780 [Achromobacter sp. HZ34]